jgi:uncharacterized protein YcbK (DUF882 family)
MGDISEHFSRSEFACNCGCGFNVVDAELIKILEGVHVYFGRAIGINSGARCAAYNAMQEHSAKKSQHLLGKAADINVVGIDPEKVATFLEEKYPNKYGIGRYNTFTHVDVRSVKARWDFRK